MLVEFQCPESKNDDKNPEKQHFKEQLDIQCFETFTFTFAFAIFSFLTSYQHWHCLSKYSPDVRQHRTRPLHSVSKKYSGLFHWPGYVWDLDKTNKTRFAVDRDNPWNYIENKIVFVKYNEPVARKHFIGYRDHPTGQPHLQGTWHEVVLPDYS